MGDVASDGASDGANSTSGPSFSDEYIVKFESDVGVTDSGYSIDFHFYPFGTDDDTD